METILIELTNSKAYKLLEDLEELNLIKVIRNKTKISDLRGRLTATMTNEEIDNQLKAMRDEWQRDADVENTPALFYDEKIALMQKAATDPLFLADMKEVSDHFDPIDHETI